MKSSIKLEQIQSKIDALKSQQHHLIEARVKEISALVMKVDLTEFDNATLMGGLLSLSQNALTNPKLKEEWRQAGLTFLRRPKSSPLKQIMEKKSVHATPVKSSKPSSE